MDEIEVIRKTKESYSLHVVFISGNSDQSTVTRTKFVNPLSIILKPIDKPRMETEFNAIMKEL